MDSICTSKEFTGFRDPYSGEPLAVRLFVMPGGRVRYRIEGAHDVGAPCATFEEALGLWSRVGGVAGIRDPAKGGFVCAYTGNVMVPVRTPGDARFKGGFRPVSFLKREEVLKTLAYISGRKAPSAGETRVEAVPEIPPAPRSHEEEPSDEALRRAGDALEKSRAAMESAGVAPARRTVVTPGRKLRK